MNDFMISHFANEEAAFERRQRIKVKERLKDCQCGKPIITKIVPKGSCLPPEIEEGNIEYKMKLVNPTSTRIQHLITQMKWRLREGLGEAIYEIGVEDDGTMIGLTDAELHASMKTLQIMIDSLSASMVVLGRKRVKKKGKRSARRQVVEILIRKVPDNQQFIDLRLAILGGVDVGKSTLCGVLTQGVMDNGRGKARLSLFRYLHEFQSGRTSSVCVDVFGFNSSGEMLNYSTHCLDEIVKASTKLISLIDLAGDRKYIKTTIYGLSAYLPHYAALVVSASSGATSMTREHLGLAVSLNIPVFVVITKIDAVSSAVSEKALKSVEALFTRQGIGRAPKRVQNNDDAIKCASSMNSLDIVPIFAISNVTNQNIEYLKQFLNVLPASGLSKLKRDELSMESTLFSIDEVFLVPHVGRVVCGLMSGGILYEDDKIQIGPYRSGKYHSGRVESIYRNKQPVSCVRPGEVASVAISMDYSFEDDELRKGLVLIGWKDFGVSCRSFMARFYLLCHTSNEICAGFRSTIYIGSVRQAATIAHIDRPSLVPCVWSTVTFEFYSHPEFVRVGCPLIFRQGRTRGMGEVIELLY